MSYGGFRLRADTPATERVLRYVAVDIQTRCWNWLGHISPNGYGRVAPTGRGCLYAHRYSYEAFVGPIPEGLEVDHLCRNRACCNPEHLEPVTPLVNNHRGIGHASKTHCPRGHAYDSEHGVKYGQRRYCRTCQNAYARAYQARLRAERRVEREDAA